MLRQGMGTADEYTIKFNTLMEETNIQEDASHLDLYKQGLNNPLIYQVYGLVPIPDTLQEWKDKVITFDNQFCQVKQFSAWKSGKAVVPPITQTPKAKDPDAMDIDQSKLRKLTDEE